MTSGHSPPPVPAPRPAPSTTAPRPAPSTTSSDRSPLPFFALAALLGVAVAVLAPWPGTGIAWVASSPVGLALLAAVALLIAPVTVDLLAGRDRAGVMLLGPPLMVAAAAGTVVVSGGDLAGVLASQGLGADQTTGVGVVAAALLACLVVGVVGASRRSTTGRAAGAPAIVVGVCAAVSAAAVSALVLVLGAPAPQSAAVATAAGATPATGVRTASSGTACPVEAANTLPEAAVGAPVVAHDSRVHIAICQGTSGALYYYGADDRTHLTITLPATRSEDSWIATNNGVTYFVTAEKLMVTKPGVTLADEALSSGWTR